MKGFLILLLLGLIVCAGVFFVHYAPVCTIEYSCAVTRDIRGQVISSECPPTVRDYQNKYQAYALKATIIHDGSCTNADRERRK